MACCSKTDVNLLQNNYFIQFQLEISSRFSSNSTTIPVGRLCSFFLLLNHTVFKEICMKTTKLHFTKQFEILKNLEKIIRLSLTRLTEPSRCFLRTLRKTTEDSNQDTWWLGPWEIAIDRWYASYPLQFTYNYKHRKGLS